MTKTMIALFLSVTFSPAIAQSGPKAAAKCEGRIFKEEKPETVSQVQDFWRELQSALRRNDQRHLAAMASYPLNVSGRDRRDKVHNQNEFIAHYSDVFPSDLRAMLLRQPIDCVGRVGSRGFSVAQGQVWFDRSSDGTYKILAVNTVVYPEN